MIEPGMGRGGLNRILGSSVCFLTKFPEPTLVSEGDFKEAYVAIYLPSLMFLDHYFGRFQQIFVYHLDRYPDCQPSNLV